MKSHRCSRVLYLRGLCEPEPVKRSWLFEAFAKKTTGHRLGSRLGLERRQTRSSNDWASVRVRAGLTKALSQGRPEAAARGSMV